jgi:hypothetical protein
LGLGAGARDYGVLPIGMTDTLRDLDIEESVARALEWLVPVRKQFAPRRACEPGRYAGVDIHGTPDLLEPGVTHWARSAGERRERVGVQHDVTADSQMGPKVRCLLIHSGETRTGVDRPPSRFLGRRRAVPRRFRQTVGARFADV